MTDATRQPAPLTPLMIAAGRGQVSAVAQLLAAGADVHAADRTMGATALHFAALGGAVGAARLLLDAGAFIDAQTATVGLTPLVNAIWAKHVPMVELLLDRGAAIEIRTHLDGATAWDFVDEGVRWTAGFTDPCAEPWGRRIRELLETRRERDRRTVAGQRLIAAVQAGDREAVRRSLAAGVDVDERSPVLGTGGDGQTPLLLACFLGHAEIVRDLLDAGADPRLTDYLLHATPVHKGAYAGRPEVLSVLREHGGADVNAQGPYNGYTATHDAVWHGHRDALAVLLAWPGVRLDLRGIDGRTPEELARHLGYLDMAETIARTTAR